MKEIEIKTGEIIKVVEFLLKSEARKATKFLHPKLIIRATRKTFGGKLLNGNLELFLTIGKPNYEEGEFVRRCLKVGEPFPIKKIQLKFLKKKGRQPKK